MDAISPHGESPEGAPRRSAVALGHSYFLDRFVVALASVITAIGIAFGAFHSIGLRPWIVREVLSYVAPPPGHRSAHYEAFEASFLDKVYPFDPAAPLYEQFVQYTLNVLTWSPITVALCACGILAVAARRYAY